MKGYIKRINGSIIACDKIHYAQDLVCYRNKEFENKELLILNDIHRAIPYATYIAEFDIGRFGLEDIPLTSPMQMINDIECDLVSAPKHHAAYLYFKENIEIIKKQVSDSVNIPENLEQPLYRGLFTDVFSVLELFLSDVILCLIYNCDDKYYEKAIVFFKKEKKIENTVNDIEGKVHKFFYDEIVYHRFEKVKDIFKEIFDIDIPDYEKKIKKYLHKRNNIVHRYSYSNKDREHLITLSKQDILDWISVVETFVGELVVEIENKVQETKTFL